MKIITFLIIYLLSETIFAQDLSHSKPGKKFYPGPRTSIRFEKLIEGIQDFEKIRILREQFAKEKKEEDIRRLDQMLSVFELEKLKTLPAADMVSKAKELLNKY